MTRPTVTPRLGSDREWRAVWHIEDTPVAHAAREMIGRDMRVLIGCAALCGIALTACNQTPPGPLHKTDRVAKAEAAMAECKKRVGLEDVATPSGMVLDDPATRGQEMTPEMAGQLRLKVQCALELNELLAARTDAK